jgi:calcineurin-like phosphoesterase family protein
MIKLNIDESKLFFTSDLHFKHYKNLEYSGRPFKTIEEHDDKLISNINEVVGKDDHLFILGDFIFTGSIEIIRSYYNRINGIKYLILGNHDLQNKMYRQSIIDIFEGRMFDSLILSVNNQIYNLSHFPYAYFTGYNLHGHIHSGPNSKASERLPFHRKRWDCGADNNDYYPPSLKQIKEKLKI